MTTIENDVTTTDIPTKEELRENLRNNILKVTFLKLDGSLREMTCTLKENIIPEIKSKKETNDVSQDKPAVNVWDCEANGWRSFRYDRLQDVEILE